MNIQVVPARKYYGKHATGGVVLIDLHPVFHGTAKDAKEFAAKVTERRLLARQENLFVACEVESHDKCSGAFKYKGETFICGCSCHKGVELN